MNQDIRSFFAKKKEYKKTEEDSDVIPNSPDVKVVKKKKQNRKRILDNDSDEEIQKKHPKKELKSPKPNLKEVNPGDIFGKTQIKRTEPVVKKPKKKTETGIHSDEEFEESLLQIDDHELYNLEKTVILNKENHVDKSDNRNESNSEKKSNKINKVIETDKINSKREKDTNHKEIKTSNSRKRGNSNTKEPVKNEKQNFNEFIEDEVPSKDENELCEPKKKKLKLEQSLNESVLSDEERHERKRYSAALYQKYLNRTGPKHLGTKVIPEGLPECLKDCAFLLTGVLDSFERDDIVAAITKYGGTVKSGISKKVTHVLAGDDAGPAKLAKAQELGIKILNEDEFLKMIKDSTGKKTPVKDIKIEDSKNTDKKSKEKEQPSNSKINKKANQSIDKKSNSHNKLNVHVKKEKSVSPKKSANIEEKPIKIEEKSETTTNPLVNGDLKICSEQTENENLMWVDKYKPQSVKNIIGQHGDKSNAKKLINWLTQWYASRKAKILKPSPWAKDDNGAYFKAALLSGPPGVGKTTTVSLVCKELGFDMVEFNASDTRSKTLIREQIGELLTTTSLSAYAKGSTGKGAVSKKHVLVMDEVDGMAGNEDRGGLQELISLIKSTSVPVICICNERNSEKMRSLVNYCYDLRFERPRVNQIMCAMLSVCYKEGVKVPNDVLTQLIEAAGHDVRQTLHMLSMWVADSNLADPERLKNEAAKVKKDIKKGPWEAIRKVFSAEEHKKMSINEKSDLFFSDYSIMPLFVQENYLNVVPHISGKTSNTKLETLERMSRAADSISLGDLVEARIRGSQAWSLLPMQAMYSSVVPGHVLQGHMAGQIQFPGWLGKNSRANKMRRMCQEIHAHTRLSTSGSKSSIFLDYAIHIRDAVCNPLINDKANGIEKSLEALESYHLLREDLESLIELSLWPEKRNPIVLVDPKVKAAMTRTYNKKASALPYAPGAVKKGRAKDDSENSQECDEVEGEEDSDPENDALIKKKKNKEIEKAGPSKTSTKGKKNEPFSPNKDKGKKSKKNSKR